MRCRCRTGPAARRFCALASAHYDHLRVTGHVVPVDVRSAHIVGTRDQRRARGRNNRRAAAAVHRHAAADRHGIPLAVASALAWASNDHRCIAVASSAGVCEHYVLWSWGLRQRARGEQRDETGGQRHRTAHVSHRSTSGPSMRETLESNRCRDYRSQGIKYRLHLRFLHSSEHTSVALLPKAVVGMRASLLPPSYRQSETPGPASL